MVLFGLGVAAPSEEIAKSIVAKWNELANQPKPLFEKYTPKADYQNHREKWFADLYLKGIDYFSSKEVKTAFEKIAYSFLKSISLDFDYATFGYEAYDRIISDDVLKEMLEDDKEDYTSKEYSFQNHYKGFVIKAQIHSSLNNSAKFLVFKTNYFWIPYEMEHGAYDV
jgi:hypothetical protein